MDSRIRGNDGFWRGPVGVRPAYLSSIEYAGSFFFKRAFRSRT